MRRIVILAATAALALAACGGDSGNDEAGIEIADLAKTEATTKAATTARMAFAIDAKGGDEEGSVRGEGAIDFERGDIALELTVEEGTGEPTEVDVSQIDGIAYARVPEEEREAQGIETEWVRTEEDFDVSSFLGGFGGFGGLGDTDQAFTFVSDADEFEVVGEEEVRDEPTTHFRAELSLSDFASDDEDDEGAAFLMLFTGGAPVPVDVWVDGDNRLRKYELIFDFSGFANMFDEDSGGNEDEGTEATTAGDPPEEIRFTMGFEFFDFGADVTIEAPPGEEVSDAPPGFSLEGDDAETFENTEDLIGDDAFDFGEDVDGEIIDDPETADEVDPDECTTDKISEAIDSYRATHGEDAEPTPDDLVEEGLLTTAEGITIEFQVGGTSITVFGTEEC
ncbi:MAG: hypothetical protein ACT4OX_00465 [Actinomycetota bacterium]